MNFPLADGVVLRPVAADDAEALAEAYTRNREHLRHWDPDRPDEFFTPEGQAARVKDQLEQRSTGRLVPYVLADGDTVVGCLNLNDIVLGPFRNAHLGYWVDARYNGRGLATAATLVACRVADERLRLHRIQAGTLLDNAASQRVLVKAGFEPIGVAPRYLHIDGAWQDHRLFQRILNERPPGS
ncbi:GNAT family N-acetyltransferase [Nonomuraea cavernae]|uniref:Ribosomal protein S5 alanine N-acetyltransferase n=1 Tax=Nonomuraea cavernae TaxID=2045107 RepID=A0A917YR23_9ACTN|nr:GNAT family protein [Nonomuraea cavernae]MCA2183508.1 GNAT family N-acetyltransferase [Nonomuraea cavernae]GGO60505.1 ribosomal protein S5 alanine N-acetyltransferase [Nonomuraea cavernae]